MSKEADGKVYDKLYDSQCWNLAEYFLEDYHHSATDSDDLAFAIQEQIEDWFQANPSLKEKVKEP